MIDGGAKTTKNTHNTGVFTMGCGGWRRLFGVGEWYGGDLSWKLPFPLFSFSSVALNRTIVSTELGCDYSPITFTIGVLEIESRCSRKSERERVQLHVHGRPSLPNHHCDGAIINILSNLGVGAGEKIFIFVGFVAEPLRFTNTRFEHTAHTTSKRDTKC